MMIFLFGWQNLPEVSSICRVFDVITNGFKHFSCCCHRTEVKDLDKEVTAVSKKKESQEVNFDRQSDDLQRIAA
jgi:hypothetical protein